MSEIREWANELNVTRIGNAFVWTREALESLDAELACSCDEDEDEGEDEGDEDYEEGEEVRLG
ncbi:MAG: hypothetical protein FWD17_02210 [Polyangiaceae bacterium]|nr:hypothetical protein [Polyangiaceae bacterium]